jgi:hypothetical protein
MDLQKSTRAIQFPEQTNFDLRRQPKAHVDNASADEETGMNQNRLSYKTDPNAAPKPLHACTPAPNLAPK